MEVAIRVEGIGPDKQYPVRSFRGICKDIAGSYAAYYLKPRRVLSRVTKENKNTEVIPFLFVTLRTANVPSTLASTTRHNFKSAFVQLGEGLFDLAVFEVESARIPTAIRVRISTLVQTVPEHFTTKANPAADHQSLQLAKVYVRLASSAKRKRASDMQSYVARSGGCSSQGQTLEFPAQILQFVELSFGFESLDFAEITRELKFLASQKIQDVTEQPSIAVDEILATGIFVQIETCPSAKGFAQVGIGISGQRKYWCRIKLATDIQLDVFGKQLTWMKRRLSVPCTARGGHIETEWRFVLQDNTAVSRLSALRMFTLARL